MDINSILVGHTNMTDDDPEYNDERILAFGETLGASLICIGVGKENYGKVYVYDGDFGATKLSESFKDFIQLLE